jgi:hypothetical protein
VGLRRQYLGVAMGLAPAGVQLALAPEKGLQVMKLRLFMSAIFAVLALAIVAAYALPPGIRGYQQP